MIRSLRLACAGIAVTMTFAVAQLTPAKIVLLVGPPGSGKTTQAKMLEKRYGIRAISMADLLKKEVSRGKKDRISKALASSLESGDLLPDAAAIELVRQALLRSDLSKGFVLDGFPASAGQAKALDRMMQEEHLPKAVVVVLDAPDEVIRKRMIARRRADDKPEIIERRIREFRNEAAMLAGWAGQTHVVRVNAEAATAPVSAQIVSGLEDIWSKQPVEQ